MAKGTGKPGRSCGSRGIRTAKERVRRLMRGARSSGRAPRGPHARADGARRDHHHRGARRHVGDGHDGHCDRRRGGGLRFPWPSITVRPSASGCMRPRGATASRPWSRSARAFASASGASATASPAGCDCGTTTGPTTWLMTSNRRSPSSASRAPPSFVREARRERRRGALHPHAEGGMCCGCEASRTIEALRLALLEFKRTYNEQWMLEKYRYRSPAQVRHDLVRLDAVA